MSWQASSTGRAAALGSSPREDGPDPWAHDLAFLLRPCGCARFDLTDREIDVLEQIARGRSTSSAARALFLSPQAVTYHVGNLLAKFQCSNRTGLVARAFVLGVLTSTWPPGVLRDDRARGIPSIGRPCAHRVAHSSPRRSRT